MNIEETKYDRAADEGLSQEEQRIAQMLGGLNRVAAPGDFELHVKGGIAKGRPAASEGRRLFPILGYSAPVVLAIAAGFLGFSGMFSSNTETTATVATRASEPVNESSKAIEPPSQMPQLLQPAEQPKPAEEPVLAISRPGVESPRRRTQAAARIPVRTVETPAGGSRDSALKGTNNVLLPRGLDPAPLASPRPEFEDFQTSVSISAGQILSLIGAETEVVGGRLTVKAAKADSLAERSGLKPGDVVQAMDGREVKGGTIFKGSFENKSVTVLRGGKPVVVQLRAQ